MVVGDVDGDDDESGGYPDDDESQKAHCNPSPIKK